ncbi:ABC transporter substrate-binding protein [Saccharomonospora sp. NPDC046836]|uniref:ABC transporter substrate-binding protein n=1 Tax=Saccharomonospora sp. NPDC046836 TaxID=3156921 RepID=UPI0033FDB270
MSRARLVIRCVAALSGATLLLTACSSVDTGDRAAASGFNISEADRNGSLVYGSQMVDRTLDPLDARSSNYITELAPIFDTLMRMNPDGELEPGLAEGYEIVDSRTMRLTLREGVEFSDGEPLDAEAIRTNLLRVRDAESPELNVVMQEIEDVVVESPTTLVVKLHNPVVSEFVHVLYSMETMPVSPAQLENASDEVDSAPIGAGPYRVVGYSPNQRVELERIEDHWDAENWPIKKLTFQNVMDGAPTVTALASGDIDMARTGDVSLLKSIQSNPNLQVATKPGMALFYINYCKSRAPFDDPDARRAVALGLDRELLAKTLTAEEGTVAYQVFPESSPNYNPDAVTKFDPAAARDLLGGKPLEFDLRYNIVLASAGQKLAEIMQAQLAEAGITMNPLLGENSEQLFGDQTDAVLTASTLQGIQKVTRQLGPDAVPNLCKYNNDGFNDLTATIAAADPSSTEATDAWREVAALIDETQLFTPLFFLTSIAAFDGTKVNSAAFTQTPTDFRYVYVK